MAQRTRLFFSALLCSYVLLSCDDGASEIGSGFFQAGSLDVMYIDSVTVQVSTVQYDSIPTSDATRFLVGYHHDQDMGKLFSSAFLQIAPENALSLDPKTTSYSRTLLVLNPDGYSQYDTAHHLTINVHLLTQEMETRDDGYLYNTSKFAYSEDPLGTLTFLPKPNADDSLAIELSDSFGESIIALAQQDAEEVSGYTAFIEEFKGIAIMPDSTASRAIIGIEGSPEIRVYYWDRTTTPSEEKYLSIKGGQHIKFNQVIADRTNTMLSTLTTQLEPLESDLSGNVAYIQGGTGLAVRIEFPYLKEILIKNPSLSITDAVLEFYPAVNAANNNSVLVEQLDLASIDDKNNIYSSNTYSAVLIKDEYLGRDTYYQVDVRSFITQQLATEEINRNAFLASFTGEQYRQSVDVLKIADQSHDRKMRLKLYCVVIKN